MAENNSTSGSSIGDSQSKSWSKERVLQLIALYKQNPCLYDVRLKSTRDERRLAISQMATELDVSEDAVNRKIHSLRSSFAREKYIVNQKSIHSTTPSKGCQSRWCFYQHLRFLDEFFMPKVWSVQDQAEDSYVNDNSSSSHIDQDDQHCTGQSVPSLNNSKQVKMEVNSNTENSNDAADSECLQSCPMTANKSIDLDRKKKLSKPKLKQKKCSEELC
jgi:hypothetical protein